MNCVREVVQVTSTEFRAEIDPCGYLVTWWDGEYEATCELPEGHEGHHFDGMSCFDDYNEEVSGCEVHS